MRGSLFVSPGQKLINEIKELGHYPRESRGSLIECRLLRRLRDAIKFSSFEATELAEVKDLQLRSVHPIDKARSSRLLEEAEQPPDPMEGFADEATNRLDQDLLILASGQRTRPLMRCLKQYKDFVINPAAHNSEFATKYADRILETLAESTGGPATYVPGGEIAGDELRTFSDKPIISGPLVCQLCDADFTNEKDFAQPCPARRPAAHRRGRAPAQGSPWQAPSCVLRPLQPWPHPSPCQTRGH